MFLSITQQYLILMKYNLYQLIRHKILNKIDIKKISIIGAQGALGEFLGAVCLNVGHHKGLETGLFL